ncbi:MAG: TRAP transporter small permease [Desulfobulbaceae bacterium]|nr:TRAP transporter small permease [Desulfobulbaceae bacterium]
MTDKPIKPEERDGVPEAQFLDDIDVKLSDYSIEDYVSFFIFWVLAVVVFVQFFSRYVLNDSVAWTEEIARYLLIGVAFAGAPIAVRKNTHIQVEFFYRFINRSVARVLSTLVDVIRVVFFAYGSWISFKMIKIMNAQYMTSLDLPMSVIYVVVLAGFVLMTIRSTWVLVCHFRQGYSNLDYNLFVKTES